MTEQLFKKNISNERFYNFLQGFCEEETINQTKYFVLSKTAYKKLKYKNLLEPFCEEMKGYYHHSKSKYVDNVKTFNKFVTIIRQICTVNDIVYISKAIYIKSVYEPVYYILTEIPDASTKYFPSTLLLSSTCCEDILDSHEYFDLSSNSLSGM
tara:strand:+ start:135 stop:596 length:462 start_codon:yes stop_codon:yes gene_type:complete